jgi:hypothetical protein
MAGFDLESYVTVQERIQEFYAKYPDGSLQFEFKGILEGSPQMMWGIAFAYRHPGDERPGIGTAAELIEGKTPYTRGSELQNLESSAWGRCLAALGLGISKGIASKQEVQGAKDRQAPGPAKPKEKEVDPWAIADAPDFVKESFEIPVCNHGHMQRKTGFKKDGSPYAGWICADREASVRCEAIWDRS